jgi:hypothetical protein
MVALGGGLGRKGRRLGRERGREGAGGKRRREGQETLARLDQTRLDKRRETKV